MALSGVRSAVFLSLGVFACNVGSHQDVTRELTEPATEVRANSGPANAPRGEAGRVAAGPTRLNGGEHLPNDEDAGSKPAPLSGSSADRTITLGETRVLAPLAGPLAVPAAGQEQIGFYGTDLGRSTVHAGALRLLFGDTWASADSTAIDPSYDDVQGTISLSDFPDGPSVDAYVAAHRAKPGDPAWLAAGPPVTLLTRAGKVQPIVPERGGMMLGMGLARTPVAVWSDGKEGLFAILNRLQPLACNPTAPRCPKDFECDTGLGSGLGLQLEGAMPCVIGVDAGCVAVASGGFCQDRTSSVYDATDPNARKLAVAYTEEMGNEDLAQPGHFRTTAFHTNKFINPSARTVADFDPARSAGNDFRRAPGSSPNEKLFIWGRPWFSGARGRDARLYFMYLDLPRYSPTGELTIAPRYFTGLSAGMPQFSAREVDARPVDLSYSPGDPTTEEADIAGELSISWIEPLQRWMLLSGGDYAPAALAAMQGAGARDVVADRYGGIRVRFASQPWGPWSPPQYILRAHTDSDAMIPLPNAPDGILARPDCTRPECPRHESAFSANERGTLYSAHLIEPWTTQHGHQVDVYWVVSTWNPYQVVLLKTTLSAQR